jgi:hypothetical protein
VKRAERVDLCHGPGKLPDGRLVVVDSA